MKCFGYFLIEKSQILFQDFLSFVSLMQFFCFRDFIGSLMSEQYWQMYEGQQRNKGSDNTHIKSETNAVCDFPQ